MKNLIYIFILFFTITACQSKKNALEFNLQGVCTAQELEYRGIYIGMNKPGKYFLTSITNRSNQPKYLLESKYSKLSLDKNGVVKYDSSIKIKFPLKAAVSGHYRMFPGSEGNFTDIGCMFSAPDTFEIPAFKSVMAIAGEFDETVDTLYYTFNIGLDKQFKENFFQKISFADDVIFASDTSSDIEKLKEHQ